MEYFHGSTIKGLTELKPFASNYSNLKQPHQQGSRRTYLCNIK